jgi:hypothetical protein
MCVKKVSQPNILFVGAVVRNHLLATERHHHLKEFSAASSHHFSFKGENPADHFY